MIDVFFLALSSIRRPPVAAKKVQPCDEIVDKLFLGSKACASTTGELKKRNIELTIGVGDRLKLASDEVLMHANLEK